MIYIVVVYTYLDYSCVIKLYIPYIWLINISIFDNTIPQMRIFLPMLALTDPCELSLNLPGSQPTGRANVEVMNDYDSMELSPTNYQQVHSLLYTN